MKKSLKHFMLAAALAGSAGSAYAVPTLYLNDGAGHSVTIADQSGGDLNGTPGVVVWTGGLGVWTLNVTTGVTGGTAGRPSLDLNSVDASSGGSGTLTIKFSNDGLGPTTGSLTAQIGGTAQNGTVVATSWEDPGNVLLATVNNLTSQAFGSGAFSGTTAATLSDGGPYSLTEQVVIHHTGAGLTSLDYQVSVPDTGSTLMMLLGSSLTALGFFARSRKTAQA